jgi:hypothetical protein
MYSAMILSVVSERLMLMRSLRRDMVDTVKRVESGNSQIIKRRGEGGRVVEKGRRGRGC